MFPLRIPFLLLAFLWGCQLSLTAQQVQPAGPNPNAVPGNSDAITLSMPAAQMADVIDLYQDLAMKRVIRDPKLESVTISIETKGQLTRAEALDYMEKTLLLAGYTFVPAGPNMVKLLASDSSRLPATEGVPMILRETDLPHGEQVVSYVMRLQHLRAEDAAQAFGQIIPPHAYGRVAAVPNTRSLILTENSNTIRAYIALAKQVDVPPTETRHQTIALQRSDATDVAEQLSSLLGLGQEGKGPSSGKSGAVNHTASPVASSGAPANAQEAAARAAAQVESVTVAGGDTTAEALPPKIQAIPRTNSLLVIARPLDIEYIQKLVAELDAESPTKAIVSRQLHYIDLRTFINIAGKALLRNQTGNGGGGDIFPSSGGGGGSTRSSSDAGSSSGLGSSRMGGGMSSGGLNSGGSLGGSLSGGGSSLPGFGGSQGELDITRRAESVLIGRTLVIVDPASSKFFASGPPDELKLLNELADELDVRPRQIFLSVIIGEFTLGDDMTFGLDWIRTLDSVGSNPNNLVGGVLNTQGTAFTNISKLGSVEDFIPALSGLTVYGHIGDHLNVFLQTLEQTKRFKVLQKPTITTLNHQPASIHIGQDIAIAGETLTASDAVTSTGTSIRSTTQYIPVRLELEITPHIYNNREVMLEFQQQNNDISGYTTISGNQVPNISTQGLKNTLIVPDRTTAMLGGLITVRDRNNKTGLPILIRIPVIKHLFGSTSKSKERRELLIFVQPRILETTGDHLEAQDDQGATTLNYDMADRFGATPLLPARTDQTGAPQPLPLPAWQDGAAPKPAKAVPVDERPTGPRIRK